MSLSYSGFLLIILQRVVSVCSAPPSHFLCPPPFPFGNHKVLCYVVRPFLFFKRSSFVPIFRIHLQKISYDTCLPSSSVIISASFLGPGHGAMSPFFMAELLLLWVRVLHLVYHSSVLTHLGVIHVLATVHNAAMKIGCICLLKLWFSLYLCPGLELLGPIVLRSLVFNDPLSCSPLWI